MPKDMITLPKKSYRPDEVAEILCLSRRTVYRMIKQGRLQAMRFGNGPWRIPWQTLEEIHSPEDEYGSDNL